MHSRYTAALLTAPYIGRVRAGRAQDPLRIVQHADRAFPPGHDAAGGEPLGLGAAGAQGGGQQAPHLPAQQLASPSQLHNQHSLEHVALCGVSGVQKDLFQLLY